MAETKKPTATSGSQIKPANPLKSWFPYIVIILIFFLCEFLFYSSSGISNPANFEGGEEAYEAWNAALEQGQDPEEQGLAHWTDGHPIEEPASRNFLGLLRKGGFVIPIGLTLHVILWVFFFERLITLLSAGGRGNTDVFVKKIRRMLGAGDIQGAMKECDKQKGSVGNVIKAGLRKYEEMAANDALDKDAKKLAIQQEIEEATMLELPMLERNLSIISTLAALGTLVGLIGTVLGMIRAFSALGAGGAPNAAELSVGISEALVNTALGITTSAVSIVFYNFFTTRIDGMTYAMDEAGYSIVQTFDVRH
jgi:biopolymer transport protein ExbB